MDNLDGNLAALAKQEKEWEINEQKEKRIIAGCEEVLETIQPELDLMKSNLALIDMKLIDFLGDYI